MTNANRKTTKNEERNLIDAALASGKAITTIPAEPKNRKPRKASVAKLPKAKKSAVRKAKDEAQAKGSVIAAAWKTKAGKAGVWRSDKLDNAVRSAFLAEGSDKVEPAQAARIATDAILTENHLDAGRWAGKNAGMLSMNLRNVLRAMLRNDGVVFVYGKKISA